MRFEGKVAIITGGASGIGKATCKAFTGEGASVVILDLDEKHGEAAAEELRQSGGKAVFIKTDISREEDIRDAVGKIKESFGTVDILVNNAALFLLKSIDATVDDWRSILGVNVVGAARLSFYVSEIMKEKRSGVIIQVSSISGTIAQPDQLTYNVTKAALIAMTKCMALDLAPYNIRVNCICPGYVLTEHLKQNIIDRGMTLEEAQKMWGKYHMLGRMASPEEIAPSILFLANDRESSFITGSQLYVDGGYTAL